MFLELQVERLAKESEEVLPNGYEGEFESDRPGFAFWFCPTSKLYNFGKII